MTEGAVPSYRSQRIFCYHSEVSEGSNNLSNSFELVRSFLGPSLNMGQGKGSLRLSLLIEGAYSSIERWKRGVKAIWRFGPDNVLWLPGPVEYLRWETLAAWYNSKYLPLRVNLKWRGKESRLGARGKILWWTQKIYYERIILPNFRLLFRRQLVGPRNRISCSASVSETWIIFKKLWCSHRGNIKEL